MVDQVACWPSGVTWTKIYVGTHPFKIQPLEEGNFYKACICSAYQTGCYIKFTCSKLRWYWWRRFTGRETFKKDQWKVYKQENNNRELTGRFYFKWCFQFWWMGKRMGSCKEKANSYNGSTSRKSAYRKGHGLGTDSDFFYLPKLVHVCLIEHRSEKNPFISKPS